MFTELERFRQRSGWRKEAHFVDLATKNAHIYGEAVRILAASDVRFTCLVAECDDAQPGRKPGTVAWKVHAQLAIALLGRVISGDEIVSVTLDDISLPAGVNYESYVRQAVNRQKDRLAVATVSRMDSRACWGIQMTDVLTGAVAHQHRQQFDPRAKAGSAKGSFAAFVAEQFNLPSLIDAESRRVHVVRHGGSRRRRAVPARTIRGWSDHARCEPNGSQPRRGVSHTAPNPDRAFRPHRSSFPKGPLTGPLHSSPSRGMDFRRRGLGGGCSS